ncbi:MAG: type III pantothenate kinase [bacterium]
MTWVLVDMGNTRLKWSYYEPNGQQISPMQAIAYAEQTPDQTFRQLLQTVQQNHHDTHALSLVLVHVLGEQIQQAIDQLCKRQNIHLLRVHSAQSLQYNIHLAYQNPAHYGADRFVGLLAAHYQYPKQWCLVVDCGTAITVDLIDPQGQHQGGLILAGLSLCQQRLLDKAQGLSHVQLKQLTYEPLKTQYQTSITTATQPSTIFADNTQTGIINGCLYSTLAMITSVYDACLQAPWQLSSDQLIAVICGGDAAHLHSLLQRPFVLQTDLLMCGLGWVAQQHSTSLHQANLDTP